MEIKSGSSVKLLGILMNKNLTWNNRMKIIENKISKYVDILYQKSLRPVFIPSCFSYIFLYFDLVWKSSIYANKV